MLGLGFGLLENLICKYRSEMLSVDQINIRGDLEREPMEYSGCDMKSHPE